MSCNRSSRSFHSFIVFLLADASFPRTLPNSRSLWRFITSGITFSFRIHFSRSCFTFQLVCFHLLPHPQKRINPISSRLFAFLPVTVPFPPPCLFPTTRTYGQPSPSLHPFGSKPPTPPPFLLSSSSTPTPSPSPTQLPCPSCHGGSREVGTKIHGPCWIRRKVPPSFFTTAPSPPICLPKQPCFPSIAWCFSPSLPLLHSYSPISRCR